VADPVNAGTLMLYLRLLATGVVSAVLPPICSAVSTPEMPVMPPALVSVYAAVIVTGVLPAALMSVAYSTTVGAVLISTRGSQGSTLHPDVRAGRLCPQFIFMTDRFAFDI